LKWDRKFSYFTLIGCGLRSFYDTATVQRSDTIVFDSAHRICLTALEDNRMVVRIISTWVVSYERIRSFPSLAFARFGLVIAIYLMYRSRMNYPVG
jgi:hypothetical protein